MKILLLKLFFPEKKVCFDDVSFSFLIWVYTCALRVLTPHPPSLVLMFDCTPVSLSVYLGPNPLGQ